MLGSDIQPNKEARGCKKLYRCLQRHTDPLVGMEIPDLPVCAREHGAHRVQHAHAVGCGTSTRNVSARSSWDTEVFIYLHFKIIYIYELWSCIFILFANIAPHIISPQGGDCISSWRGFWLSWRVSTQPNILLSRGICRGVCSYSCPCVYSGMVLSYL